jgi:hypothetical protein
VFPFFVTVKLRHRSIVVVNLFFRKRKSSCLGVGKVRPADEKKLPTPDLANQEYIWLLCIVTNPIAMYVMLQIEVNNLRCGEGENGIYIVVFVVI